MLLQSIAMLAAAAAAPTPPTLPQAYNSSLAVTGWIGGGGISLNIQQLMYFDGANNKSRVHAVYSTGLIEVSIDRGDLGYSYMYQIEGGKLSDCRKNAMAATGVRPNSLGPKPSFMGAETVAGTAVQHWRMAPTQYNPTQLQVCDVWLGGTSKMELFRENCTLCLAMGKGGAAEGPAAPAGPCGQHASLYQSSFAAADGPFQPGEQPSGLFDLPKGCQNL